MAAGMYTFGKMKRLIYIILFLLVTKVVGQSPTLDSLINNLAFAREDTNKIKSLLDIEEKYFLQDLDSALYYNNQCEKLILKLDARQYKHQCYHDFVKIYHAKKDFANSLAYCLKAIKVAQQNENRFQEASSYRAVFNLYHNLNMNDSAVKYAVYSLELTTEIGDTANIATNYGNLCWLYMDLEQYDKALEFGKKGIESGEQYIDTIGLLISTNNLALCYQRMNENKKAIELFKKQLEIGKRVNRARSIRYALINLGVAYYFIGDAKGLEESVRQLNEFNNANPTFDNQIICLQYINNAYNSIFHENFTLAEEQLFAGMKIAEMDSLVDPLLTIYIALSKVKFAQHDFVSGNQYEEKWETLNQAQNSRQLSEYAVELEKKYETEKKSVKIALQTSQLKHKTIMNYLLAGTGIGLLIITALGYRTFRQKQKLQERKIINLEREKQLTATEAVLKGEELERTRLAKDLHDGLGGMLSGIKFSFTAMKKNLIMTSENQLAFERSIDMLDSCTKEMRRVAHNMMPESLIKYGLSTAIQDYCNDINESKSLQITYLPIGIENVLLEQTTAITIYRVVQELINNILKHSGAKTAIVQISNLDGHFTVTVEDDGRGFDTSILKDTEGMGWTNIRRRIELLKANLDVNSQKGHGTSVQIDFSI